MALKGGEAGPGAMTPTHGKGLGRGPLRRSPATSPALMGAAPWSLVAREPVAVEYARAPPSANAREVCGVGSRN
jgi:hypothetical protein